jgi:hypothetical protein
LEWRDISPMFSRGEELVSEPVESERWLRRGEEPYSRTVTTPDAASASQRERIGRF